MKTHYFIVMAACAGSMFAAQKANAQEVVVAEEVVVGEVSCKDNYFTNKGDNWFLQLGAGINSPFFENSTNADTKHVLTPAYNLGVGRWFSPYIGTRLDLQYGQFKWKNLGTQSAKYGNANIDIMWDMFNSLGGVNANRFFSLVPFAGVGGTFAWDFDSNWNNDQKTAVEKKHNSWSLPVSAGLQMRFRLAKHVDFFLEGRAQFYADNANLQIYGDPIDMNITALGGFNINFGGRNYQSYNACNDLAYISSLNNQVNSLRADLAATAAALAVAESQLPCPEVVVAQPETVVETAPMLSTVRFTINSDNVTDEEMVNVYNVAEYLKANPSVNVVIEGYADKDTGTAEYNQGLSERRAQAVADILTKKYGIDKSRYSINAEGSSSQPYSTNNWNRIVIFAPQQ